MQSWSKGWAVALTVAAASIVFIFLSVTRSTPTAQSGAQTSIPRTAGKPDFSGIWEANNTANWDLQTHAARPMVAQPGFAANSVVLAAPVLGLGSIGLLSVAGLLWLGAGRVYGVDPVDVRRELALGLGAEAVFARSSGARAAVDGAPVVLECSGRPEAIQQALDLALPGGRVVLLGIAVAEISLVPVFWITREITVTGSINSQFGDFEEALRLLAARPEVGSIVTTRIGLAQVPAAFLELLHPAGLGKVVIDPRLSA